MAAGQFDRARRYADMAIRHARMIAQPFVMSQALSVGARAFAEAGDCDAALDICRRCADLCDAQNLPFWKGWAMVHEGVAMAQLGQFELAKVRLARAIEHLHANGGHNDSGYVCAWRAQALAHLHRFDEARRAIDAGRADCARTEQLIALTELAYARGVTELLDPEASSESAEYWLSVALEDTRSNALRLVELRAATSLALLWQGQDRNLEARAVLAPVYGRFSEGFDCKDLKQAEALLGSLGAGDRVKEAT